MSGATKFPSYEQIAVAVANLIRQQALPVGYQLESMVALGKRFGVSRETVRHGVKLLDERGVVSLHHGKGALVLSPERADLFLLEFHQHLEIKELSKEITHLLAQQENELEKIKQLVSSLTQKLTYPLMGLERKEYGKIYENE